MIYSNFNFHPIGQGFFYTGNIAIKNNRHGAFNFVYDCGTNSKRIFLDNETTNYKNILEHTTIDLLVISHFDSDHVNGVVDLLKGIRCKRLVIPYYSPSERLVLYAVDSSRDDEYLVLLRDPIAFFSDGEKFRIDEIVVVGGGEDTRPAERGELPPFNPDYIRNMSEQEMLELESIEGENDSSFEQVVLNNEHRGSTYSRTIFVRVPVTMKILGKLWEFVFYLREFADKNKIAAFQQAVDTLLTGNSIFTLFDKKLRSAVQGLYKQYFKAVNFTSLCLYHGPLFKMGKEYDYWESYSFWHRGCIFWSILTPPFRSKLTPPFR